MSCGAPRTLETATHFDFLLQMPNLFLLCYDWIKLQKKKKQVQRIKTHVLLMLLILPICGLSSITGYILTIQVLLSPHPTNIHYGDTVQRNYVRFPKILKNESHFQFVLFCFSHLTSYHPYYPHHPLSFSTLVLLHIHVVHRSILDSPYQH